MSLGATLSSRVAAAVLAELIAGGVRDIVVCPGSRSQALALAAAEAERLGAVRLHVRVDERSAGFFALGVARETGVPAAVIVTSGTALGNLMPAVLEASHARQPMVVLSADRPPELRGVRANQTVWSNWFLADFARRMVDIPAADADESAAEYLDMVRELSAEAMAQAVFHRNGPGPAHLNIGFRDPLSGGDHVMQQALQQEAIAIDASDFPPTFTERVESVCCVSCGPEPDAAAGCGHEQAKELETFDYGDPRGDRTALRSIVVAGADAGPVAQQFASAAGLPLLAEPSSGARFGEVALQHWERLLGAEDLASRIEQVIVFGNPTLTRAIPALVQRDGVAAVVIDPAGPDGPQAGIERFNPGRAVGTFALAAAVSPTFDARVNAEWLAEWRSRDVALRDSEAELNGDARITRAGLVNEVWLASSGDDRLVVAASRLIRELNRIALPRKIQVHANRGLAGIDGTVATALGIAVSSQAASKGSLRASTTRLLIGDLALLHDAGSLLLPPAASAEIRPRIQVIVGNDGGGTIFDTLEAASTAAVDAFDRVMFTPQQVDISALARAYGWRYSRAETHAELQALLADPPPSPHLIEVPLVR